MVPQSLFRKISKVLALEILESQGIQYLAVRGQFPDDSSGVPDTKGTNKINSLRCARMSPCFRCAQRSVSFRIVGRCLVSLYTTIQCPRRLQRSLRMVSVRPSQPGAARANFCVAERLQKFCSKSLRSISFLQRRFFIQDRCKRTSLAPIVRHVKHVAAPSVLEKCRSIFPLSDYPNQKA